MSATARVRLLIRRRSERGSAPIRQGAGATTLLGPSSSDRNAAESDAEARAVGAPDEETRPDPSPARGRPDRLVRKLSTYAAGSVVATVCSELTLVVCYGLLDLSPAWSAVLAWLAGAVPNYWLNRTWTWRRRGRPSLRRELLPYAVIILVTLAIATASTRAVDAAVQDLSAATRTVLVAMTFLGVYVVMFVLRYLLLDRLFRRLGAAA